MENGKTQDSHISLALAYALISGSLSIFFGAPWLDGLCAACTGMLLAMIVVHFITPLRPHGKHDNKA